MNLQNMSRRKPIVDVSKEEQTSELINRLYKLVLYFVKHYQPIYFPKYKGSKEDLAADIWSQFMTAKSRVKGKEESLLDKWNPEVSSLEYLTKVSVIRMLIDMTRKAENRLRLEASDVYDKEEGIVTLDYLASKLDEPEEQLEKMEFSEKLLKQARESYWSMDDYHRKHVKRLYEEAKNVMAPNFRLLFEAIFQEEGDPWKTFRSRLDKFNAQKDKKSE